MGKKKKIIGALMGVGIALGAFAGGTAVYASAKSDNAATETVAGIERHAESQMPYKGSNGKQPLSEEQIAALETYAELSKEIYQKYNDQYAALLEMFDAEVEGIYASVLGEPYRELTEEYEALIGQYQGLVNGFYGNEEYIALKTELNALVAELGGLNRNSAEYQSVMEEIHEIWGKISVLAGEVNSQITIIRQRAVEITAEIRALIAENKETLKELLTPLIEQFNADTEAIRISLMTELEFLTSSLNL